MLQKLFELTLTVKVVIDLTLLDAALLRVFSQSQVLILNKLVVFLILKLSILCLVNCYNYSLIENNTKLISGK